MADDDNPTFGELIERSSLGTPEALAWRRLTPPSVRDEILAALYGPDASLGEPADVPPET
jgi:hypothetical protein